MNTRDFYFLSLKKNSFGLAALTDIANPEDIQSANTDDPP